MATKFMNIPNPSNSEDKKKDFKPTVFTHFIDENKIVIEAPLSINDFDNILWLGYDMCYGDMFKAWDNGHINYSIFFGVKGDEDYL